MVLPLLRRYFLISRGSNISSAECFHEPIAARGNRESIPLSMRGESSAFVPQSRKFTVTG